ncbi:universal stress protein [Croceicoccus marinus]|jgi:nucleotide-binding universal stress UspA family protein|uniref:Universal stress protein n=1 Tax=Croceicoccus marinus TaxID=450378 RepID=A0A7G6VQH0_9SPHN|nr:universal stress protein [Croceicoccus marinus]QNE03985.1 universal stress protein [Croceicoccus marinus]
MRIYLVIMDETPESRTALRFASRRAANTGGAIHIIAVVPKQQFVAFGGVQATIEEEAKSRAEVLVMAAAGSLFEELGRMPSIAVKVGDATRVVQDYLAEHEGIAALVLGAAADGPPGPLIAHFAGHRAGQLPCPLMIVPGALTDEEIDAIS